MQGFYLRILETFALIMLKVEFGAKVSFSHQKEGYVSLDRLNWDAYNESGDLIDQIENYRN